MNTRRLAAVALAAVLAVATQASCGGQGKSKSGDTHKTHYSSVYVDATGQVWCKSPQQDSNNALLWYVLYANNQPVIVSSSSAVSSATLNGASWRQTNVPAATASTFTKTDQVVKDDENGEPATDELEPESDVPPDDVINEETTPEEVNNDSGNNGDDNSGGNDSGGSDSGSDAGSGGDTGGGDF